VYRSNRKDEKPRRGLGHLKGGREMSLEVETSWVGEIVKDAGGELTGPYAVVR